MSDNIADWDAAYVLGALSLDDWQTYEAYLAANPERAAALTELTGIPGILNVLSRDEALALTAPATPQRRSRRSLVAAGVAAAAVFAIGATVFPRPGQTPAEGIALQAMQSTPRGGINAALAVTEKKWGTRLDWTCDYTKDWAKTAASYDIVVTTDEGITSVVGTWTPASDHANGLAASTAIPTHKIRTVDIRVSGTDAPLAITTMR